MADTLVTNETAKTSLTGTEEVYINDSLVDKKATISNIRGGATQTELGYVSGVTSAIQTQLNKLRTIIKTADETISSDTTFSNDSALLFTVSANTNYVGFLVLFGNSGATPDFKYVFTLPTGASGLRSNGALSAAASAQNDITANSSQSTAGAFMLTIPFEIVVGGTAGTVNFQWAQNTSDASNTTVSAGSYIAVWAA